MHGGAFVGQLRAGGDKRGVDMQHEMCDRRGDAGDGQLADDGGEENRNGAGKVRCGRALATEGSIQTIAWLCCAVISIFSCAPLQSACKERRARRQNPVAR